MNDGLIASRYANALLLFAKEEQAAERVYDDAHALNQALRSPEGLQACIEGLSEPMKKFITHIMMRAGIPPRMGLEAGRQK